MFDARDPLTLETHAHILRHRWSPRPPQLVEMYPCAAMRRQDLAAIRWLEVTIRRAGQRAAARYARYAQHEQPNDSMDAGVIGGRLGEFEDPPLCHAGVGLRHERELAMMGRGTRGFGRDGDERNKGDAPDGGDIRQGDRSVAARTAAAVHGGVQAAHPS